MEKIEDKFIKLLEKIENDKLKSEFLKCYFEIQDEIDKIQQKPPGCFPCVSNCICQENDICNGNEVQADLKK